ncbi:MAG: LysR family transcriptional regulator [Chitinophagaceae bacterium]|nr:LysR family transcriptional regulator [Rubrivivax sp.]
MPVMNAAAATAPPKAIDDAAMRRLASIDLNLLVVFSALMQDRSVTAAAARLFVGQPAVSASLKRLRTLFADPLFVKVGRAMVPTERAVELQTAVASALAQIDVFAFRPPSFDARSAQHTVRIGLSDDNEIVFLPAILRELHRVAPQVRVVARAVSHTDIRDRLDADDVSVGLSVFGDLSAWHRSEVLFEQGYGCLFDPRVGRRSSILSLQEYVASRQAIVTFDGALSGRIDRVLSDRGMRRDVCFGTSRFAALPHLVKGTAVVASLPELVGRVLARAHRLAYCRLPLDVPPGLPRMAWHVRHDADPAGLWLRALIASSVRKVVTMIRS